MNIKIILIIFKSAICFLRGEFNNEILIFYNTLILMYFLLHVFILCTRQLLSKKLNNMSSPNDLVGDPLFLRHFNVRGSPIKTFRG